MFISRPKSIRQEDEDDLLKEQEKFLALKKAGKLKPSVTQVVCESKKCEPPPPSPGKLSSDALDIGELPIIERNVNNFASFSFPRQQSGAFPKATRRHEQRPSQHAAPLSSHVDSQSEMERENDQLLNSMTPQQINEMREQVMSSLDPKLVDFLRNRGKKRQDTKMDMPTSSLKIGASIIDHHIQPERNPPKSDGDNNCNELPISIDEVVENKWLNMNIIEEDKLEWARPIPAGGKQTDSKSARFNFSGHLVLDDVSVKEGLHHHGDEPDRAGYSLEDLFNFIQSTYDAQKILGLQVLGRIFEKVHKGYFDLCFEVNIAKECLDFTDILLWVRKCLDHSSESVVGATLVCLHALICNTQIDEPCLDRLFPVTMHYTDFLYLNRTGVEKNLDEKELKDEQLAKLDAVKALIRFDTLQRIRYLMDNNIKHRGDPVALNKMFEILIRIARHSQESCKKIIDCPHLMNLLMHSFVPAKISFDNLSPYGNPSSRVLKLLRLLIQDKNHCHKVLNDYPHIWSALQIYITLDPECFTNSYSSLQRSQILHIAIETLRLWCVLFTNFPTSDVGHHFNQIYPIIFRQLQYCLTLSSESTKYDFQYASTMIKCLVFATQTEPRLAVGYSPMIESLLFGSLREMIEMQMVVSFDSLMMLTSCVEFLISIKSSVTTLVSNLLNPILESEMLLRKLRSGLENNSYLIHPRKYLNGCHRDAKCLPSHGSIYFGGESIMVIGIAQEDSSLFFLESLLSASACDESLQSTTKLINFLAPSYPQKLYDGYAESDPSLFKELEYSFIYQLCIASLKLVTNHGIKSLYYKTALICLFNLADIKMRENLLNLIIFNPYQVSNIFIEKNLPSTSNKLEKMKQVYFAYSKFDSRYWLFDPILMNLENQSVNVDDISACLEFCYLLQSSQSSGIISKIIPMDVTFTLISCTFLLADRIFAEDQVQTVLDRNLKFFNQENFSIKDSQESLPHFNNISSFFDTFLNHFQAESFLDPLFINFLLIYLRTDSHIDFRKKLLSDHSICLRFMSLKFEDLKISLVDLLYPVSQDDHLIELYLKNLLSQSIPMDSIMYLIAVHHVHHRISGSSLMLEESDTLTRCRISIEKSSNQKLKNHLQNFMDSDLNATRWAKHWIPSTSAK
ncbi:uncharacterized protein LOC141856161 [Brevipalpus obovatus]|uniref:uncharacterized protein LOC141856161 n=1 Tax=Brevipalpus obovatus TaxID=246614 RepID=UPI003D9E5FB1